MVLFSSLYHGGIMQQYWAYSLRAFFVASISGLQSDIIAPNTKTLASTTNYYDYVTHTINLDSAMAHLDLNKPRFEAAKRKYKDGFSVSDPGHLGAVLISSEMDDLGIDRIIDEFEIERLDDYLARSRRCRQENTEK